jgi:hypothetical protein
LSDPTSPEVGKILNNAAIAATALAAIAKEIEFYVCGDISEEVFLKRYKKLEQTLEIDMAGLVE